MEYNIKGLPRKHIRQVQSGFTLLELMIVLVVVGILVTIAYPSFIEQIRKSRRADAITEVNQVAQAQERYRANNASYATHFIVVSGRMTGVGISTDTNAATTYTGTSGYYAMTLSNVSATRYTITATASGTQASDARCTALILDVQGGNLTYDKTGSATANQCWNR